MDKQSAKVIGEKFAELSLDADSMRLAYFHLAAEFAKRIATNHNEKERDIISSMRESTLDALDKTRVRDAEFEKSPEVALMFERTRSIIGAVFDLASSK